VHHLFMKAYSLDLREKIVAAVGRGMSTSVSVLFVLERFLESYPPGSGEYGAISALGPGFSAEHVLFRC
jgi:predicted naringenin-chalcone synthase